VMPARVLRASGDSDMDENELRMGGKERAHLASRSPCVKGQRASKNAGPLGCYATR
jgi:hypothetical protein